MPGRLEYLRALVHGRKYDYTKRETADENEAGPGLVFGALSRYLSIY